MHTLVTQITQAHRIALVSHINPDGDAIGSLLGLALALQELGKEVIPVLHDGVPEAYKGYLTGCDTIQQLFPTPDSLDLCIVLDLSTSNRTGFADVITNLLKQGRVAVIDHHPLGDLSSASGIFHSIDASSTCELVGYLIPELGGKFTVPVATALLTGIYTDTGGFQHANTTPSVMEMAAELMRRGARLQPIVRALEGNRTLSSLKILGLALERATKKLSDKCILSVITAQDYEELGLTGFEPLGIVSEFQTIDEGDFILLLSEAVPGTVRGMIRSVYPHKIKVNALARLMGGGGHDKAAGFSLPGHLVSTEKGWKIVPLSQNG